MIAYKDIRQVHLEISTKCNAACPDCLRNFRGVDVIDTYPLCDMSLEQAQTIFTESFVRQLTTITINGNYGDFVTARDGLAIVEYFRKTNPMLLIKISTNASARPKLWEPLAKLHPKVYFRIDGLQDTHKLYRQNTDFDFIIDNARKYIAAGGYAVWSMIEFDHNRHQIEECKKLSKELGFKEFELVNAGRDVMPVFTPDKRLSHIIGNYTGTTDFDTMFNNFKNYEIDPEAGIKSETEDYRINCYVKQKNEIYVSANGEVYPCCWLGYYPLDSNSRPSNIQLKPLIENNNALEHGMETAVAWFNRVEESWDNTVANGKIYECNRTCGIK